MPATTFFFNLRSSRGVILLGLLGNPQRILSFMPSRDRSQVFKPLLADDSSSDNSVLVDCVGVVVGILFVVAVVVVVIGVTFVVVVIGAVVAVIAVKVRRVSFVAATGKTDDVVC